MIQNLLPGAVKQVQAHEIEDVVYLYRTEQGGGGPGLVSWQTADKAPQILQIVVGQTVPFPINGAAGTLTNNCPSVVRVLRPNQLEPGAATARVTEAARI
ncbi:hypothetical protein [Hymenobacter cellulosilyticus]|uniref:Uncharacterized protein n=1 Tax=Hymenobacter cellulosilyticus TaxID=2932248 RepID=A0A8T9Q088_9BACT|nr:hypothetical protein [Hymenobacter cellulosilyticus]UOQ71176.1 hypothetical protein MUN79_21330 [Hymenobacter cellulosilyticus]